MILKNAFYIGKVRHGNEVFEGKHEAIVSRDLWERVQAVRAERCKVKKTAAPAYRVYLLNGIVRCAVCRQTLRVQRTAGHSYYRHTFLIRGIACSEPDGMVREERLADQIDELVNRLSIPDDWQNWLTANLRNNGHDPEELERERERLAKKLDRLKRASLTWS